MYEQYKLMLIHEMVLPDGIVQRLGEPICALYTVDRRLSGSPVPLNSVLDSFKDEVLKRFEKESEASNEETDKIM